MPRHFRHAFDADAARAMFAAIAPISCAILLLPRGRRPLCRHSFREMFFAPFFASYAIRFIILSSCHAALRYVFIHALRLFAAMPAYAAFAFA